MKTMTTDKTARKKKICIVSHDDGPGGGAHSAAKLAKGFYDLGYDVDLVALASKKQKAKRVFVGRFAARDQAVSLQK